VAYHEGGHALIATLLKHTDPVHKVSIIPRGGAGGYTLTRPKEDRNYATRSELLDTIKELLGGRVAEAIVLDEISTGAQSDLERATAIARKMICQYGMSERLGPVTFGQRRDQVFMGRDFGHDKDYSEEIASAIDHEVKLFIEKAYAEAETILRENIDKLHLLADSLLEWETLEAQDIASLMEHGCMPADKGKVAAVPEPVAPPLSTPKIETARTEPPLIDGNNSRTVF
jgi:cell division protease FtsH